MKVWLITGCSSGIGKGIAQAVLKRGDCAVVTSRNTEKLKELKEQYPDTCMPAALDLTDEKSVRNCVKSALERFGRIDVLVNNAGYAYLSAMEEGEEEAVRRMFQTNFFGPVLLMKEVLLGMRQRREGTIINITSIAASRSTVASSYYSASKAALELLSDGLAKEVQLLGIKVIVVEPGAFRTGFYEKASMPWSKTVIADYEETVGARRKRDENSHNQPGDPDRAGEIIVSLTDQENPPSRLILGSDAVRVVSETLKKNSEELEKWKELSIQSDF